MEGVAVVGEPLGTDEVGCRRVLGTDLPLNPCDLLRRRAWEALEEDERDRSDQGRRSYPCAARGTRVYPKALACLVIIVTLRSRYCAS